MKFRFYIILLFILGLSVNAQAGNNIPDSLLKAVEGTSDWKVKIKLYRDLADFYAGHSNERVYLRQMYVAAKDVHDKKSAREALSDLAYSFMQANEIDSASYYMSELEQTGKVNETLSYMAYLRMNLFDYLVLNNREEQAFSRELSFLDSKDADKNSIYIQIEQAYTTGRGLRAHKDYEAAAPYLKNAYELSLQLQGESRFKYYIQTKWLYANNLHRLEEETLFFQELEEILIQYKENYDKYLAVQRPFYNIDSYILQCYASFMVRADLLSEERLQTCLRTAFEIYKKTNKEVDKYNYFLIMNNYYLLKEEMNKALATNDSIIKYAYTVSPRNVASLTNFQSRIYESIGNYKEALNHHKRSTHVKDSLFSADAKAQLNELQVKYEVDQLNYKNIQLENKNKQILLIALGSILLLTFVLCWYLYRNLKKEKRTKQKLYELNEKAGESEKMKTAFLNSMCHEIRTPLNAIVGFSGIIVEESIDQESKKEFYELITTNTNMLTSLIDHLLVVANLDSSEEKLPCDMADVIDICRQQMELAKQTANGDITYNLELPEGELYMSTNDRYLSLVIENLLNNANKFTEHGSIMLKAFADIAKKKMCISVTDTGCGIPLEKQEVVFERFTKLDDFKQGNGLGLYLCRLIVKRLSGVIYIDSNYHDGTRVVIELDMNA